GRWQPGAAHQIGAGEREPAGWKSAAPSDKRPTPYLKELDWSAFALLLQFFPACIKRLKTFLQVGQLLEDGVHHLLLLVVKLRLGNLFFQFSNAAFGLFDVGGQLIQLALELVGK